jgi:glycosyltransferase involved in cell wall biosynthesis
MGLLGYTGPIIELAADATLIDLKTPLSGRPRHERLAHRFGETQVDATLAVSDTLAAYARTYDRPVRVVHPFVLDDTFDRLIDFEPGGDGETILCVGKYVEKNGQDVLVDAMASIDTSVNVHFVGPGTDAIKDADRVHAHGFVELDRLVDLFNRADLMVFPARVGAYPVAVLEAMVAATPVLTTPYVGNADLVRSVDPGLVVEPNPEAIGSAIDRAMGNDLTTAGEQARSLGRGFTANRHLPQFVNRFNEIVTEVIRT